VCSNIYPVFKDTVYETSWGQRCYLATSDQLYSAGIYSLSNSGRYLVLQGQAYFRLGC